MSAFLFLDTKIHDASAYEEYKSLAKPIAEKFGGNYRVRGGDLDILQAELWQPTRIVIIEFPSAEQARAFVDSDEYSVVKPLRMSNSDCTSFIVEAQ